MGFKNLQQGDQFVADYEKYKIWRSKDSAARQTLYEGLNVAKFTYAKQEIFVAPFAVAGRDFFVQCSAPKVGEDQPCSNLLGLTSGYFEATAPTTAGVTIVGRSQYPINKLAKLTLKLLKTVKTTKDTSRITGSKYYRHSFNSASMPFGKKTATDTYEAAVAAIKGLPDYKAFENAEVGGKTMNSIKFTPEG